MKKRFLFLLFLLVIPIVQADIYTKQVFSGGVYHGHTYTTSEDEQFTAVILSDEKKVLLRLPLASLVVSNDSCSHNDYYEACVDDIQIGYYNYSLPERIVWEASIVLKSMSTELSMNKSISPLTIIFRQQSNFSVIIKNEGTVTAENITFTDSFADAIDVVDVFLLAVSDCEFKNDIFQWKGELEPGKRMICYALLQGKSVGTVDTKANLEYYIKGNKKTALNSEKIIVEENPVTLVVNGTRNIEVGEETTLFYNLSATGNLTLNYVRIQLPEGVSFVSKKDIPRISSGIFELKGSLLEGQSKAFEITMLARKSGNRSIKVDMNVYVRNLVQEYSIYETINITIGEMEANLPTRQFDENDKRLSVIINNPTKFDFSNVKLQLSGLIESSATFDAVEKLGHVTANFPLSADPGNHTLTTTLAYESLYGEAFEKSRTQNITIRGLTTPQDDDEKTETDSEEETIKKKQGKIKYVAIAGVIFVITFIIIATMHIKKKEEPNLPDE